MRCEAGQYFFAEQTGPPSPIRARKPPLDARFASCPGMPAEPDGIPGLLCNRFPFPCLRLYTIGFRRIPTCVSGPSRQWCEAIGMSTGTPHGSMQPGPAVVWSGDCGPGFAMHACLKPPFPLQGGSAGPGGGSVQCNQPGTATLLYTSEGTGNRESMCREHPADRP